MAEPITIYKLTILNMLDKVDFPLTNTQISNFFLEQDYTDYAHCINNNPKVKMAVTLFQSGPQIAETIRRESQRQDFKLIEANNLEQAVLFAYEELKSCGGGIVLFSPTAPSFGFYKNFMERGQHFIDIVNKLDYK